MDIRRWSVLERRAAGRTVRRFEKGQINRYETKSLSLLLMRRAFGFAFEYVRACKVGAKKRSVAKWRWPEDAG